MKTNVLSIDHHNYLLAQGQNVGKLQRKVVRAVRRGGDLVRFTVVGNREISALISVGLPVLFEVQDRPDDERDNGDLFAPYDPNESLHDF